MKSFKYLTIFLVIVLATIIATTVTPLQAETKKLTTFPGRYFFAVKVVSSAPYQVTGGDARIHIEVPRTVPLNQVKVLVNGVDQASHFSLIPGTRTLTGVIDGLALGRNVMTVRANGLGWGRPFPMTMVLTNYLIKGPVFSGPHQHPFVCTVQTNGLGEPLADNPTTGIQVTSGAYSKDCSIEPHVEYDYKSTGGTFKPYSLGGPLPDDMAKTTTSDGQEVNYIVRWERGTINRFIYSIAMLAPFDTSPSDLNRKAWNKKLIYHFQGGVAIGHSQGNPSKSTMLYDPGLSRGYAVAYSTGTRTDTHYNLVLGGETALMVKERFIELYDVPVYTVGLGGSGGAIQQYIYSQNHPGLLNGAIPQYSYPDMVTQAIHTGDCEPMEFYMDVVDADNTRWKTWTNRTLIEGLNASNTVGNPYTGKLGASECVMGWRGLSPLAMNPLYGGVPNQQFYVPQSAIDAIEWTHFADLINIFGRDSDGYAKNYWDNVGVQYGLKSVASGKIIPEEFLKLNAVIGGWKNEPLMIQEGSPFFPPGVIDMSNWDPWSARNQVYSTTDPLNNPAPRVQGNLDAMRAAYKSGLVFMGHVGIPIIDWRNYLEDELDMHNSHQSFASRQRIRHARGHSNNQVIWFTDYAGGARFDQTPEALEIMDEWQMNIINRPWRGVEGNKPLRAVDRCFDAAGNQIAAGSDVWDGILDNHPQGACTQLFPVYGTSRIVAGGPFKGSIFKCHLKLVSKAITDGDYGVWMPDAGQQFLLEKIFPQGVCDFSKPDVGLPPWWWWAGIQK